MKHLRKTSGVQIGRVVSSCSFLALVAIAFCGPYGDLNARLQNAHTVDEKVKILADSNISDKEFQTVEAKAESDDDAESVDAAVSFVNLKAMAESAPSASDQSARIKQIKSSALFADEGKKDKANWLSGALDRMKNLIKNKEDDSQSQSSRPNVGVPSGFSSFLIYFVWFLLFAAILSFIIYALRFVNFGKMKRRRAKAMLSDDEPERTLDEWITLADGFERDAKYREAVRALYLACLLKFDERNVARFIRSQTNWEHLARIESSPRKPVGIDFRSPTQAFDQVWYGHKVRGSEDVRDFKAWYSAVSNALQEAAA